MSLAAELSGQIPYLRRYARSVMGSQASADNYVAALLEALISDPTSLPNDRGTRTGLYRMFVSLWSSIDLNLRDSQAAGIELSATRTLQAISPLPRQAFLCHIDTGHQRDDRDKVALVSLATSLDYLVLLKTKNLVRCRPRFRATARAPGMMSIGSATPLVCLIRQKSRKK